MRQTEDFRSEQVRGVICYIGIGSNQERPLDQCREALRRIADGSSMTLLRSSSFYRTEPVGFVDQEDFVNAVAEVRTVMTARALLQALQQIETEMGRVRTTRWGPRIIDLDILLFGQEVVQEGDLVIPHPELHRRRFILVPLNELASYVIHPAYGVSIQGLMQRLQDESRVERIE